ncbi:DNA (cytosine-5-)-methyltransferase [Myxococcus stipitatus]|uniref:DNA cytosine methyltransferase n=1 Tax=Myxococcus stipitatus TaxID=83455 RepID=UPI0030CD287C
MKSDTKRRSLVRSDLGQASGQLALKPNARAEVLSAQRLTVAGLFAGVGGIELGLHRAGHRTSLLCENEPGAKAVLESHFPNVALHGDVCTLKTLPSDINLVAAGFPCQDLSQAGKTAGIDGDKSGLIGHVFRLIAGKPIRWLLLENVPFMLQLARGRALEVIVGTLEQLKYKWAYRVVDSRAFGVPQRRERVYLLASQTEDPRSVLFADEAGEPDSLKWTRRRSFGFYWTEGTRGLGAAVEAVPTLKGGSTIGIPSPPAIILPGGRIVTPSINDAERMQGFPSDWTAPASNVARSSHRWKLIGNAVTVDVAEWIGSRLAAPGDYNGSQDSLLRIGTSPWPRAAYNVGEGRFIASLSSYPLHVERCPLHHFLEQPRALLSERATRGFYSRAKQSTLNFPPGFLDSVRAHLDRMERNAYAKDVPKEGQNESTQAVP